MKNIISNCIGDSHRYRGVKGKIREKNSYLRYKHCKSFTSLNCSLSNLYCGLGKSYELTLDLNRSIQLKDLYILHT